MMNGLRLPNNDCIGPLSRCHVEHMPCGHIADWPIIAHAMRATLKW